MDWSYLLITIILFALMPLYFKLADRYNIIDKPNQRSSHTQNTIRGGGVIFPFAMILYFLFFQFPVFKPPYNLLTAGMVAVSVVSFWDDIKSLPNLLRVSIHLLSVTALLLAVQAFTLLPVWLIVLSYILIIGTLNAYNFMDGINGITGVYSLAILLSCWYFNANVLPFTDERYILTAVLACLVFLFFNFRKKARCFAGDVGSVSIGFWIISLLMFLILQTGNAKYLFFLSVYGVDAVLTIVHRLWLRQNIFEAHRLHLYQILSNEQKVPHLVTASIYGILQLSINCFIIGTSFDFWVTGLLVCVPLGLLYLILKRRWMKPAL
jgi:UDP-N-acetylmuramyl pentapeptide phosphotransferase/UDP-N-acetylglucosamine-1-phosphate transferase